MLKPPPDTTDVTRAARIAAGLYVPSPDEAFDADAYPPDAPDGVTDMRDVLQLESQLIGESA